MLYGHEGKSISRNIFFVKIMTRGLKKGQKKQTEEERKAKARECASRPENKSH